MKNRYLLFQGDFHYPYGGVNDAIGFFHSKNQAKKSFDSSCEWVNLIDIYTGQMYYWDFLIEEWKKGDKIKKNN